MKAYINFLPAVLLVSVSMFGMEKYPGRALAELEEGYNNAVTSAEIRFIQEDDDEDDWRKQISEFYFTEHYVDIDQEQRVDNAGLLAQVCKIALTLWNKIY